MSKITNIEWCDSTFNPWIGCTKISPGCDHCYAEKSTPSRTANIAWGPGAPRQRTSKANWEKPLAWNRAHAAFFAEHGRRQRVFCASLSDVFDNAVESAWRADLFALIEQTPNLDWLLLTKRIGNVRAMVPEATDLIEYGEGWQSLWGQDIWPENVWLGATIVNQEEADRDIPKLLAIPAARRFLSMEPLLGAIDLRKWIQDSKDIDWIIAGGESGPDARPMFPGWVQSLRNQCADAGVPFLLKQWGEWHTAVTQMSTGEAVFRQFSDFQHWVNKASTWVQGGICLDANGLEMRTGGDMRRAQDENRFPVTIMHRVGKKSAGRQLDGKLHDGYPGDAQT